MADLSQANTVTEPTEEDKEIQALRQAFASFDKDGNGSIDAHELKECLKAMGQHPGPLEVEELLAQMDTDGNGVIDFEEFAAVMGEKKGEEELEAELKELKTMFVMLDNDGNGTLDAQELRRALRMLGVDLDHEEAEYLFKEIDADGDGGVNFEEFATYVWKFDDGKGGGGGHGGGGGGDH